MTPLVNTARLHFGAGAERAAVGTRSGKRFTDLHCGVRQLDTRAQRQMVSCGGKPLHRGLPDDEGAVWIMLHRLRNIGKELADRHMAVAAKLPHNTDLPDRDLAVSRRRDTRDGRLPPRPGAGAGVRGA